MKYYRNSPSRSHKKSMRSRFVSLMNIVIFDISASDFLLQHSLLLQLNMNTSLLSSHLHGSRIFVSSFCDSTSRRIQKSTYHEPDFSSITREYEGYSWYSLTCSKANVCLPPPTIKQTKYYMRASIPFLDGDLLSDLPPSHIGYSLDLSVLHYIEVWGKEGNSNHMHGDLSYANIIQNNDNVFFIDWEHFT